LISEAYSTQKFVLGGTDDIYWWTWVWCSYYCLSGWW
jgi:hypothetical protein